MTEDDKTLIRQMELFTVLANSEGWKELERICKAQIAIRQSVVTSLCANLDDCIVREGVKGAMIGISLPFDTVRTIIEQGQDLVRQLREDDPDVLDTE